MGALTLLACNLNHLPTELPITLPFASLPGMLSFFIILSFFAGRGPPTSPRFAAPHPPPPALLLLAALRAAR